MNLGTKYSFQNQKQSFPRWNRENDADLRLEKPALGRVLVWLFILEADSRISAAFLRIAAALSRCSLHLSFRELSFDMLLL